MSGSDPSSELLRLLNDYCNGTLTEADAAVLKGLLLRSEQARQTFILYMDLNAELQWQAGGDRTMSPDRLADDAAESEVTTAQLLSEVLEQERAARQAAAQQEQAERARRLREHSEQAELRMLRMRMLGLERDPITPVRQYVIPRWLVYGAAAAVLVLAAWLLWPTGHGPAPRDDLAEAPTPPAPVLVAQIIGHADARWSDPNLSPQVGAGIYNRPMRLEQGSVTIRFQNQAVVTLEAPCSIEPASDSVIRLNAGKLIALCETPASKGFVVKTPSAEVVDLGTAFGVLVRPDRVEQLFVYTGEVVVNAEAGSARVASGEAGRVTPGGAFTPNPDDAAAFLPPADLTGESLPAHPAYRATIRADEPLAYWPFESINGVAENIVNEKYPAVAHGRVTSAGESLNRAARLDGGYLHVHQPIAELTRGDYTIELWARPDRNAVSPIIGLYSGEFRWGGMIEAGTSLRYLHRSPASSELNEGTNVFADQPLATGVWQHIVAVHRGGDVLLYIDGRRVGGATDPLPLDPAPQLIIGGGDAADRLYRIKQQYHGLVDELAIYDRALTETQITHHFQLIAGLKAGQVSP